MGRAALIAIAAFAAIGALRATQQASARQDLEYRDAQTRFEMLARAAALFGYERGKQALAAAPGAADGTRPYQEGSYTFSVRYASSIGTIRAVGTMVDEAGATLQYNVISRIQREVKLPSAAPLFMQFALLAADDLTLSGSILVDTFRVEGDTRAPANANIHTNGTLKVNGAAALVRGFGTYAVAEQVGNEARVFKPYNNPSNAAVLLKTASIPMPAFTPAAVAASVGADQVSTGNVTLSGTVDFTALGATRDDPYVWHVKGNVTAQSSARLKGYVVFLVDGSLELSGGEAVALDDGYAESNAAWYTGGEITFKGNSEIWGQFYTGADIKFSGTPRIYGSITTRQKATISGNPSIYYVPGSAALTTFWQPATVRLKRLSYSEGW